MFEAEGRRLGADRDRLPDRGRRSPATARRRLTEETRLRPRCGLYPKPHFEVFVWVQGFGERRCAFFDRFEEFRPQRAGGGIRGRRAGFEPRQRTRRAEVGARAEDRVRGEEFGLLQDQAGRQGLADREWARGRGVAEVDRLDDDRPFPFRRQVRGDQPLGRVPPRGWLGGGGRRGCDREDGSQGDRHEAREDAGGVPGTGLDGPGLTLGGARRRSLAGGTRAPALIRAGAHRLSPRRRPAARFCFLVLPFFFLCFVAFLCPL